MDTFHLAKKIVESLVQEGYVTYFAGGWVRDYLMGHTSDDIDIATEAPPEVILTLFPKTIPVGIAFGIVIVVEQGHQFEVATFRRDVNYVNGRKPEKIELTSPQEDAKRRDFTINSMFYDPLKGEVIDFVGGQEDIKRGVIRTIGDPCERFFEDRLRMIRAIRFAARFQFPIEASTFEAIVQNAKTLFPAVAIERVWQELVKMSKYPHFSEGVVELHRVGLLQEIFPALENDAISAIEERVAIFARLPNEAPTIFYLLELFPLFTLKQQLDLCRYLKLSNQDIRFVEFLYRARKLVLNTTQDEEWARYYANPHSQLCLEVIAAAYEEGVAKQFLQEHLHRCEQLLPHVERISHRKPVVTAAILKEHGVKPGKRMGELLKEGESIAIMRDLHKADEVIHYLRQSPQWEVGK